MGVSLDQYRCTIGCFNASSHTKQKPLPGTQTNYSPGGFSSDIHYAFMLRCLLLICMDVEKNPGPRLNTLIGNVNICNANIRSIGKEGRFEAACLALSGKFEIITMTESWLHPEHLDSEYEIPGYVGPFRLDRPFGHGGVIAWVVESIITKRRLDLEVPVHETMWLEMNIRNTKILLAVCYRQQEGDYARDYWAKLQSTYDNAKDSGIGKILLIGDFNADPKTNLTAGNALFNFLTINHLSQHITEPTRITPEVSSTLDLLISNHLYLVEGTKVEAPVHTNDHRTISGMLKLKIPKPHAYKREMWDFKHGNFDQFRASLDENNWDTCLETDDIDVACERWSDTFLTIARESVNTKDVTVRPGDKPWFNNYLRHLRLVKDRDHAVWTNNKSEPRWERYKTSRNFYFEEVDRLRDEYDEGKHTVLAEEVLKDPKKWWSLANNLMGNTKGSSYPSLIKDDLVVDSDEGKAEAFNETYLESQNLPLDPHAAPLPNLPPLDHTPLENIIVTEQDVKDILSTINPNKAYGPDGISPRLIKEAGTSIVGVLTRLFNKSLELGKFPSMWKKANVIPLYKKAERYLAANYRPVSLLSIMAKVFERIVFKYLFNYFREHFMISVWQSGFLPGSSTVTQLIEIYDQFCKAVSKGKEIRVVFLDISKAFDRVWH